jgi:two-component system, OmpR family, phosphate regulon response regulator PhoB
MGFVGLTAACPSPEIWSVHRMAKTRPALNDQKLDRPIVALLVDRDTDTREMYAEFLRQYGYEIEEALDGREALVKALSRRIDVIVSDTRLPGIGGLDLCKLLRRDSATATIPVVFVTSDTTDDDIQRASRAGATVVLPKPCLPGKLVSEIQQIVIGLRTTPAGAQPIGLQAAGQPSRLPELVNSARTNQRRVMLNHVHGRGMTTEPSLTPPALVCPSCLQALHYINSYLGGVSARHPEQWDYFDCQTGCGTFQFRHRTRNLRQIR